MVPLPSYAARHDRQRRRTRPPRPRLARPQLADLGVPYELFACDPALADTAAFCAAYGFDPEDSANTIVVVGKGDPPRHAACVTLAPYRLDVNRTIRDRLGTRKASFAPAEETAALTNMQIGGVTVFGLPRDLPVWVDARVMTRERIVLGGGSRSWKVVASPGDPFGAARSRGRRGPGHGAAPRRSRRALSARIGPLRLGIGPAGRGRPRPRIVPARDRRPHAAAPPEPAGPVQYRRRPCRGARAGPRLFRFQVVVLAIFIVLTPLTVAWDWPPAVSAVLLFAVIGLLLITGQTIIFLLRLVAADRREPPPAAGQCARRRSGSSRTRRVRLSPRSRPTGPDRQTRSAAHDRSQPRDPARSATERTQWPIDALARAVTEDSDRRSTLGSGNSGLLTRPDRRAARARIGHTVPWANIGPGRALA